MKFLVTEEKKIKDEVLVTGYFEAENEKEQEQLDYCVDFLDGGSLKIKPPKDSNKYIDTTGGKLWYKDMQMELIKTDLKVMSMQYKCKMNIQPAKGFKGNLKELREAVQAKE